MKQETTRTIFLVSTLGLIAYFIDQKLKTNIKKEIVKEELTMESIL